jgi:hypothetical protein
MENMQGWWNSVLKSPSSSLTSLENKEGPAKSWPFSRFINMLFRFFKPDGDLLSVEFIAGIWQCAGISFAFIWTARVHSSHNHDIVPLLFQVSRMQNKIGRSDQQSKPACLRDS